MTRTLSEAEGLSFINANGIDPFALPPWGRTYQTASGSVFLVWVPSHGVPTVVDVTGHPIAGEVNKAAYDPPKGSMLDALMERVQAVTEGAHDAAALVAVGLVGLGLVLLFR